MTDTPRNYVAFRGAGCACDRVPGHDRQTDLRLIGAVQIIEPISRAPYREHTSEAGPQSDAYSTDPRAWRARPQQRDNNQRNKPTYDQQGYTSAALDPRASREQRVRWIFMSLLHVYVRRWKRHWPGQTGSRVYCDSIDLSFTHPGYRYYRNLVRTDCIIDSFVWFYQSRRE